MNLDWIQLKINAGQTRVLPMQPFSLIFDLMKFTAPGGSEYVPMSQPKFGLECPYRLNQVVQNVPRELSQMRQIISS